MIPAPPVPPNGLAPQPSKTSKAAVWSLVLGLLGLCTLLPALPALILGIVALVKIRDSGGSLTGRSQAVAGIILSAATVILVPIIAILASMAIPAFTSAQKNAELAVASQNAQALHLDLLNYAVDHEDRLPGSWQEVALSKTFSGKGPATTLQNYQLLVPGKNTSEVGPGDVVIRFEAKEYTKIVEVFGDGSAKTRSKTDP
ncbi:MAG: DUF4190 domain-containing protein [Verrucomicrobiales bacterium]